MTACVKQNSKAKGGALSSRVLRSAMAAVLAVGLMPTAAFAAGEDGGISTMATVSPATDFSNGSVTAAVDNDDSAVNVSERPEWTVDGNTAHYVIPTQVTTGEGTVVNLEVSGAVNPSSGTVALVDESDSTNTFTLSYYVENEGGSVASWDSDVKVNGVGALKDIWGAGTYYAVVTGTAGDYEGGTVAFEFGIASKSLENASLYVVGDDFDDVSNTDIVFKGSQFAAGTQDGLWIAVDGKALGLGDATLSVYKAGSTIEDEAISGGPEYAGDYVAIVTGAGEYTGSKAVVEFTIDPFDISTADFGISDIIGVPSSSGVALATINGEANADLAAMLKLTPKYAFIDGAGTYTMTVSIKDGATNEEKASIIGTKDVSFNVLDANAANLSSSVFYGSSALAPAYTVDHSKGDADFDASKIVVKNGSTELNAGQFTVSVTDEDGNTASVADLSTPGVWTVKVTVDPTKCEYKLYGSAETTVTVFSGIINTADELFVKYDGKVVSNIEATYDGTNLLDNVDVVAKVDDGEKVLVEGTDYEVEVIDNDTNKAVDEVVNVNDGGYTIKITSSSWKMTSTNEWLSDSVAMKVEPVEPTAIRVAGMTTLYTVAGNTVVPTEGIAYTGEEIVPTYEYTTDDLSKVAPEDAEWVALPEGTYKATLSQNGKEIEALKDAGDYLVGIANGDPEENPIAKNYNVSANKQFFGGDAVTAGTNIAVIDTTVFGDVAASAWYASPVTLAKALGYVNGVYGTKLYQPEKTISRADVVCILYNMAGGSTADEGSSTDYVQYVTKFTDVDAGEYYAEAIGWAVKTGVVYGSDGLFRPGDSITREETAAMFANYAKATGKYVAVDDADAALEGFADAASVSGWAKAEVAWAVENGVMGNGGFIAPLASITRAEVAAMAVNFQPEEL